MIRFTESAQRRILAALIFTFWCTYIGTRSEITAPVLFGDKQVATFDLWSIQHFLSGCIIGALFRKYQRPIFIALVIAYVWESSEWTGESGLLGDAIAYWKAGHEHWANRLIADPALVAIGAYVSHRFRWVIWGAVPITVTWCIANVFAPDCMAIQQYIINALTT